MDQGVELYALPVKIHLFQLICRMDVAPLSKSIGQNIRVYFCILSFILLVKCLSLCQYWTFSVIACCCFVSVIVLILRLPLPPSWICWVSDPCGLKKPVKQA